MDWRCWQCDARFTAVRFLIAHNSKWSNHDSDAYPCGQHDQNGTVCSALKHNHETWRKHLHRWHGRMHYRRRPRRHQQADERSHAAPVMEPEPAAAVLMGMEPEAPELEAAEPTSSVASHAAEPGALSTLILFSSDFNFLLLSHTGVNIVQSCGCKFLDPLTT
jgi:hypothetical protein